MDSSGSSEHRSVLKTPSAPRAFAFRGHEHVALGDIIGYQKRQQNHTKSPNFSATDDDTSRHLKRGKHRNVNPDKHQKTHQLHRHLDDLNAHDIPMISLSQHLSRPN